MCAVRSNPQILGPAYADQVIQLAKQSSSSYNALLNMLTMMKAGTLQAQNEKIMAKIHHFKVFQGLQIATQDNLYNWISLLQR